MRKKISQVEAWSLFHQVRQLKETLDAQKRYWSREWPDGGKNIRTIAVTPETAAVVKVARMLGHAVVIANGNENEIMLYAMELPK